MYAVLVTSRVDIDSTLIVPMGQVGRHLDRLNPICDVQGNEVGEWVVGAENLRLEQAEKFASEWQRK